MEQSAVSHQLRVLREHRLVVAERHGRQRLYALTTSTSHRCIDEAIGHVAHLAGRPPRLRPPEPPAARESRPVCRPANVPPPASAVRSSTAPTSATSRARSGPWRRSTPRRGVRCAAAGDAAGGDGPRPGRDGRYNDAGGLSIYAQPARTTERACCGCCCCSRRCCSSTRRWSRASARSRGAGHARLIVERFGRRWGAFAVGDLLVLNALTIVTEFIGVALALGYFGVSRYVAVPIAAALLIARHRHRRASGAGSGPCTS